MSIRNRAYRSHCIAALCLVICFSCSAWAEDDFLTAYKNKTVVLRNPVCGAHLVFDARGDLINGGTAGPWTLCRDLKVEKAKIKDGKLELTGHRVWWRYNGQRKQFLDILDENPGKSDDLQRLRDAQQVRLDILLSGNPDQAQVEDVLSKVLYASENEFAESAPDLWKGFLVHAPDMSPSKKQQDQPPLQQGTDEKVEHVGNNGVTAPHPIFTPDPEFSAQARLAKYQGTAVFGVIIDSQGRVARVWIKRPLGMGLDERAAASIQSWKFQPGTRNDKPVAVEVSVEVSFNLY